MAVPRIISIVSPAATGKTFIAVNLAAALAHANTVALVDLDFKERAVHTWLNLLPEIQAVDKLLSGQGNEPIIEKGISIYTADPSRAVSEEQFDYQHLMKIKSDFIILDMPRQLSEFHKQIYKRSNLNVWIGDPDYHHLLKLQGVVEGKPFLVINNFQSLCAPLDYFELFGVEPEKIPQFEGVYDSILNGEPLINLDREARKHFDRLVGKIKLHI